jgi:nucleoside-diphosphate-sugar epimerase
MDKHTIFITGAAGYVGSMLVQKFAAREDVKQIIGLDKEPLLEMLKDQQKLVYLEMNTADDWKEKVKAYAPDIIIHTAWQIREMYGKQDVEWKWNVGGSDNVFDLAFGEPSVARLIHFSTVSSYGAFSTNTLDHRFTEDEPFRKSQYLYAEEKRVVEEHLEEKYAAAKAAAPDAVVPSVAVVRPAAITGPRGRFMRIRFGLQSALSGQLKDSFVYRLVSAMVSFVPVTPKWLRQFIHEDDVADLVEMLAFTAPKAEYEVFNICPPGDVVLGADMAKAVGKKQLKIQPWMVRIPFFFFWHLTRGKIPTGKGAWRGYSYPIAVDGSKLTREYGYKYKYGSFDAFYYTNGRYEEFVPVAQRRHK